MHKKSRINYWSCTRFANWIRGTKKLNSGTGREWNEWHKTAKSLHKFRYWLAEDGLDAIQDIIYWPSDIWYNFRVYTKNRWIDQPHTLRASKTHIPRGEWREFGDRILPCLFDSLVDFVEIELALQGRWQDENKFKLPFFQKIKFLRFGNWRNREAGLAHLDWEIGLVYGQNDGIDKNHKLYGKPTLQAVMAKEIKELYLWWTETYKNRPDPMDASGLSAYYDEVEKNPGYCFLDYSTETKEQRKRRDKALKLLRKIEKQYEKEDDQMLVRLIKIRNGLWT